MEGQSVDQAVPFLSRISTEMMPAPMRLAFFREEFGREAPACNLPRPGRKACTSRSAKRAGVDGSVQPHPATCAAHHVAICIHWML